MRNIDKITGVLAEEVRVRDEICKVVFGVDPSPSDETWKVPFRGCMKYNPSPWLVELVDRMMRDADD